MGNGERGGSKEEGTRGTGKGVKRGWGKLTLIIFGTKSLIG